MNGFRFNKKHSLDDMEIYTVLAKKPLFAEPKTALEETSMVDGEWDYSRVNPRGRLFFKPRLLEYECHFVGEDEDEESFNQKARELAAWLAPGEIGSLEPDDEPDIFYRAKAINLYNIEAVTDYSGSFPLVFRCEPFRYAKRLSRVQMEDSSNAVSLNNPGYYVPPVITIAGSADAPFTVRCGTKSLVVNQGLSNGAEVAINMAELCVYKDGLPINNQVNGDFFELAPGKNTISVEGNNLQISLLVEFRAQYL